MRWIVQTSLRYRYLVIFLAVVMLIAGVARLRNSAVDVFPEFAPPKVEVQTLSMGLSATDVEELVTVPTGAGAQRGPRPGYHAFAVGHRLIGYCSHL
jgi:Cu/Ag efflux pump CusA